MKILHFSDLHIQTPLGEHRLREMLGKRVAGFITLKCMFREKRFQWAAPKLEAVVELWEREQPDFTVITGDLTALGFHSELQEARDILEPILRSGKVCGVPGNHDIYVPDNVRRDSFVTHFPQLVECDLQVGREGMAGGDWKPANIDMGGAGGTRGDEDYRETTGELTAAAFPYVRLLGDHLAVVGVNSAFANWNLLASTGKISPRQMDLLKGLPEHPLLKNRRVIVGSHFGLWNRRGRRDTIEHRLRRGGRFRKVLHGLSQAAPTILLHGHIHRYYWHVDHLGPLITVNAGSATLRNRESLAMLEVSGDHGAPVRISRGQLHQGAGSRSWRWELGPMEEIPARPGPDSPRLSHLKY